MKHLFLIILLVDFLAVSAQVNGIYEKNDSFLSIFQSIPIDGNFTVIRNGKTYNINNKDLSNFRILNNYYFTCYNKILNQQCIYGFEDSITSSVGQFNIDSFNKAIIYGHQLTDYRIYSEFLPGNDTMCLLYSICYKKDSKDLFIINLFNLKKKSIESHLLEQFAIDLVLGNDPVSIDLKLGYLIREDLNSSHKLEIFDIKNKKIEYEKTDVQLFSFSKDSSIIIYYNYAQNVEILKQNKVIDVIKIKKGFTPYNINALSNFCVILDLKRKRRIGERFKIIRVVYNQKTHKYRKVKTLNLIYL